MSHGCQSARTLAPMPLLWRVFAANAAVLVVATLVLVLSPATVSFPVALTEAVVLAAGLAAMLALNVMLLRRAFAPLLRLIDQVETERRESARTALAAQERERTRIARELHDEVGQALTAVLLQLERTSRRADAPLRDELDEAREGLRTSLEDVREIARRLRPEALDDLGLASALAALTNDLARRTGVRVERRLAADLRALEPDEELVVYRVAQEALTNVARHSGAQQASVTLARTSARDVTLTVRDDGCGFDAAVHARGTGLRGMRERAVLIGAALDVESRPGHGTTVRLRLP
jgi:two-component system sensor histidine kinase UhpB